MVSRPNLFFDPFFFCAWRPVAAGGFCPFPVSHLTVAEDWREAVPRKVYGGLELGQITMDDEWDIPSDNLCHISMEHG